MFKSKVIFFGALSAVLIMVPVANSQASILHLPKPIQSFLNTLTSKPSATQTNIVSTSTGIPVGPGPMSTYTVQQQPSMGSCHYRYTADKQPLPDVKCTPGATNPLVTQANLSNTICVKGYTSTIRPPAYITGKEKKANALSYGYTGSLRTFEYDHEISLELGGDPNDSRNLWVEPASPGHTGNSVTNPKDGVENKLKTAVCSGKITLKQAQQVIVNNWTTALSTLGIN